MVPFKRILVPVDFSDCAIVALNYALRLAGSFAAQVDVLHVWEQPYYVGPDVMLYIPGGDGQSLVDYARAQAENELESVLASAENESKVKLTRRLATGRPHRKIIEIAELEGFDLIVMGTHGRTGLSHLILGSVAEKVIRQSPCPVLTLSHHPGAK